MEIEMFTRSPPRRQRLLALLMVSLAWLGCAVAGSFHSRSAVAALLVDQYVELGYTVTPAEAMHNIDVEWAFSPLLFVHLAGFWTSVPGCTVGELYLFVEWQGYRKVLWKA
jgi:hypothetical protein